jgi:Flp pilus assembly protein TadB
MSVLADLAVVALYWLLLVWVVLAVVVTAGVGYFHLVEPRLHARRRAHRDARRFAEYERVVNGTWRNR